MSIKEVVGAVIVREGRILLTQRRPGKSFAFAWESPGGKAEMSDSWHSALRRECLEELGITVGHLDEYPIAYHHDETRQIMFYAVADWTGEPKPIEGQGIGWFTAEEMQRLTLTPGNVTAMSAIEREIRRGAGQ